MTLRVTRVYMAVVGTPDPLETGKVASALSLTQSAASVHVWAAAATSALSLTDASDWTRVSGSYFGDSVDTLSLTSAADRVRVQPASSADTLSLTDEADSLLVHFVRGATSTVSLNDVAAMLGVFLRDSENTLSLVDASDRLRIAFGDAADTLSPSDLTTVEVVWNAASILALTDTADETVDRAYRSVDILTVTIDADRVRVRIRSATSVLSLTDDSSWIGPRRASATTPIVLTDAGRLCQTYILSASSALALTSAAGVRGPIYRSAASNLPLLSALADSPARSRIIIDTLTLTQSAVASYIHTARSVLTLTSEAHRGLLLASASSAIALTITSASIQNIVRAEAVSPVQIVTPVYDFITSTLTQSIIGLQDTATAARIANTPYGLRQYLQLHDVATVAHFKVSAQALSASSILSLTQGSFRTHVGYALSQLTLTGTARAYAPIC